MSDEDKAKLQEMRYSIFDSLPNKTKHCTMMNLERDSTRENTTDRI